MHLLQVCPELGQSRVRLAHPVVLASAGVIQAHQLLRHLLVAEPLVLAVVHLQTAELLVRQESVVAGQCLSELLECHCAEATRVCRAQVSEDLLPVVNELRFDGVEHAVFAAPNGGVRDRSLVEEARLVEYLPVLGLRI